MSNPARRLPFGPIRMCANSSGVANVAPDVQLMPSAITLACTDFPFAEILKNDGYACVVTPTRTVVDPTGAASAGTLWSANAPTASPLASASRSHHLPWPDRLHTFMVTLLSVGWQ